MASLDTKQAEVVFVKEMIERLSCRALVIDVSVWGDAALVPDVPCQDVLRAAGRDWLSLQELPEARADHGHVRGSRPARA